MGLLSDAGKFAAKALRQAADNIADTLESLDEDNAPASSPAPNMPVSEAHERFREEKRRNREAGRQKKSVLLYKMQPGENVINVEEHVVFEGEEAELALTNRALIIRQEKWAFGWRDIDVVLPLLSFATNGKEPAMELGSGRRHGTTITITVLSTENVVHNDGFFDPADSIYYSEEEREVKEHIIFDTREQAEHWLVYIYDAFMMEKYGTLEPGFFDRGKHSVHI